MRGDQGKHCKGVRLLCRFKFMPSLLIIVSRDLDISSFQSTEEGTLTKGDFLICINVSYERVISTWFSEIRLCV